MQADVHTRSVAVTSSFSGIEIVVFGAVHNSRQPSAESGYYDVVIVLEGTPSRLVARKKSNVAGMWINTHSITFESVPSYYAIVSRVRSTSSPIPWCCATTTSVSTTCA